MFAAARFDTQTQLQKALDTQMKFFRGRRNLVIDGLSVNLHKVIPAQPDVDTHLMTSPMTISQLLISHTSLFCNVNGDPSPPPFIKVHDMGKGTFRLQYDVMDHDEILHNWAQLDQLFRGWLADSERGTSQLRFLEGQLSESVDSLDPRCITNENVSLTGVGEALRLMRQCLDKANERDLKNIVNVQQDL